MNDDHTEMETYVTGKIGDSGLLLKHTKIFKNFPWRQMETKDRDIGLFILAAIHKAAMAVSHGNNSLHECPSSGLQFARYTSAKEKINSPHAVTQGKFALIKLPWYTSKRELAAFFSHKWLGTKRREKLAWTRSGRRDWSRATGGCY